MSHGKPRVIGVMKNKMDIEVYKPDPVILMGSGETFPNSGTAFEEAAWLFPKPVRIAILETPA